MSFLDCQQKVVDDLDANFSFTPKKTFRPFTQLSDIEDVSVFVIPFESTVALEGRKLTSEDYVIQVGVIQKVREAVPPETILQLSLDIKTRLTNRNLPDGGPVVYHWIEIGHIPFYDYMALDEDKQIISVVRITYREFVQ